MAHNRDRTFASEQYEQEWTIYKNILIRTNVTQYTAWLDMRGNHGEIFFNFSIILKLI